jgi:amino acid transporter
MIFCLCAAGAYGIEEMIPSAGQGLTIVTVMVLPFVWSIPMGLVASELGSEFQQEGGYYKWVQRACGEFWGYQAGWWRTISIYSDNAISVVIVFLNMMLLMGAYVLIFISACIMRVQGGDLHRPFKVPFGTRGFIAMCVPPLAIAFLALFINGADYFVGGMVALVTGPATYFIFKKKYGGLTKVDPEKHPLNPRTGLGVGDTRRMAMIFTGLRIIGIFAVFFLPWYDDPQGYAQIYGVDGVFETLMSWIRWLAAASGALTTILWIVASRVEPKTGETSLPA